MNWPFDRGSFRQRKLEKRRKESIQSRRLIIRVWIVSPLLAGALLRVLPPESPMPNPIEGQIKDRITAFVSELDTLVRRSTLEALRGVLDTSAAPTRRGRPSGRGPGRPRGTSRGGNVEEAAAKIVA